MPASCQIWHPIQQGVPKGALTQSRTLGNRVQRRLRLYAKSEHSENAEAKPGPAASRFSPSGGNGANGPDALVRLPRILYLLSQRMGNHTTQS